MPPNLASIEKFKKCRQITPNVMQNVRCNIEERFSYYVKIDNTCFEYIIN